MIADRFEGRGRTFALLAALLALGFGQSRVAHAATAGSGTLHAECNSGTNCCVEIVFDSTTYDVYGTPVDLGTDVGTVRFTNLAITGFDGTTGLYSGTAASTAPGVFSFYTAGSFLCGETNCASPGINSFVGGVTNFGGTFTLPSGLIYTFDGSDAMTGSLPNPTIPGCPSGTVFLFDGTLVMNAFQGAATPTGSNVSVTSNTTYVDSLTGNEVDLSVEAIFAGVGGAGQTVVTAFSDASATVPANFAAQVNGSCAVDSQISCCADSDCPSGTCDGCYRAAYIDVTTTASVTGPIQICSNYSDTDDDGLVDGTVVHEASLRFLHAEAGVFVDRTASADPVANRICAEVPSLSFFVVAAQELAPGDCAPTPTTGCRSAVKSLLNLKSDATNHANDKLTWKWLKGAATMLGELGDPTSTTNYRLCIYSGASSASIAIPAGWQTAGTSGYKYKSPSGSPEGATKALLKAGAQDRAKALVKGKGTNLPDTLPPTLSLPVTVQLINDTNSVCFEAEYTTPTTNAGGTFKAKTP